MSYKTILVHLNDSRRASRLLVTAASLAAQSNGHLIGLSVRPAVMVMPAGMPGTPDTIVIEDHREDFRKETERIRAAFDQAASGRSFVAEWRLDDAGYSTVANKVIEHGRAVDLIVASQSDPDWYGSGHFDVVERLVIESGRPIIVIPNSGRHRLPSKRVVLAWNGRREAARAAFDALPLLTAAEYVRVAWINPPEEGGATSAVPGADLCTALTRHGVKCEAAEIVRPHEDVGQTLLSQIEIDRADLLVMGCYGHSRLREFVFGGATRHILRHMIVPVLMSH